MYPQKSIPQINLQSHRVYINKQKNKILKNPFHARCTRLIHGDKTVKIFLKKQTRFHVFHKSTSDHVTRNRPLIHQTPHIFRGSFSIPSALDRLATALASSLSPFRIFDVDPECQSRLASPRLRARAFLSPGLLASSFSLPLLAR